MVILLIVAAVLASVKYIEISFQDRLYSELASAGRLEATRIEQALNDYRNRTDQLVASVDFSRPSNKPSALGDEQGVGWPLQHVQESMMRFSGSTESSIKALTIVSADSKVLATTKRTSEPAVPTALVAEAKINGQPVFGPAFQVEPGDERLTLVVPVTQADRSEAMAVVFELDLSPVVRSLIHHEEQGETREAHLVQPTDEGDALFLTPLRFEENAAFNKLVDGSSNLPVIKALDLSGTETFQAKDYRGELAIFSLEPIEDTDWGLISKVDYLEASAVMQDVKRTVIFVGSVGVLFTCIGWFFFLRPIGIRLKSISQASERIAAGEYQNPIGDPRADEIGYIARSVDTLATALDDDIAKRAIVEDKLLHSATHDELTQLHNRKFAQQQIEKLSSNESTDSHSILFLDLDGFKAINDTYGHGAGDEILIAISQRLQRSLDADATLARWGGDEFVIVLPNMHGTNAMKVADRVSKLFKEKFKTSSGYHSVGCSIGIATSGERNTLKNALQEADARMYEQKQKRKSAGTTKSVSMLGCALEEDRVEVWYQPVLASRTNGDLEIAGAEVLARIRNPDGSIASPSEFLFMADSDEFGSALDKHVVQEAFDHLVKWRSNGTMGDGFHLSLNLSGGAINSEPFTESFIASIYDLDLLPEQLVIEIPQNIKYIDMVQVNKLRDIGIKIALDNIGVHHSNLSRLAEVSPEIAKIDKSWLNETGDLEHETAEIILRNLINMCGELGSTIVVEGIETQRQVERLKALGVKYFQGYYLGKPLPAGSFAIDWGDQSPAVQPFDYKKAV